MLLAAIVWLALLCALVLLFVSVARRMSTMAGRTRDLERFQQQVTGIEARLAATIDPFVARLDEIRRRSGDPRELADALPASQDTLRALAAEGRTLNAPAQLAERSAAFVVELDRAVRATAMVEHGLDALLAYRGGRELEAQTSLKRGALNLRHSREAAGRICREIAAVLPADLLATDGGKHSSTGPQAPTYLVDADTDVEEP